VQEATKYNFAKISPHTLWPRLMQGLLEKHEYSTTGAEFMN